jgi:diguanylate cyclase (GGDEF)-like protein
LPALAIGSQEPLNVPEIVQSVAAGASDPMLVVGADTRILYANAAAERLLGASSTELHQVPVERHLHGASSVVKRSCLRRFSPPLDTADRNWSGERPALRIDGARETPVDLRVSTVGAAHELYVCLSIRPRDGVGQRDLPGRDEVARAIEHGLLPGPLGLIVIDIDHFELINESLGRECGDRLLAEFGCLIDECAGDGELAARLEADRYALVVGGAEADLRARGEWVLEAIRGQRWSIDGTTVRLTASAGVCGAGNGELAGEQTVTNAEAALREAKLRGRDRCIEREAVCREQALATIDWIDRIRTGIESGALIAHYQPILDLNTGRISHYELLARMIDERGELIQPSEFVPIAERMGLIGMIDRWAIRTAVEALAGWPDGPGAPRIAVNASGRSVGSPELLGCLQEELARHGVSPDRLIIEVTETAAISSIEDAAAFGDELRALGVGFALDDFGAGFGTFYYLKHLPLDQVKIDGEFIRGIAHSASDQLFVKALVGMARALGVKAVGEFVDDQAALDCLREIGIDYAQGFHIGRPAPLHAHQPVRGPLPAAAR